MKSQNQCSGVLICPVCGEHLFEAGRSLRCNQRHTFDRAREGYFHLLPAGYGRSKLQGDTREMVQSRRRFLERGHYAPVSRAINACAKQPLCAQGGTERALTVVEAGCGEGYYLGHLARAVPPALHGQEQCFIGLDLSKEALRRAARTYESVCFVVNDIKHRICIADCCVDLLLDVFAPRNPDEFKRIMRPNGMLVVTIPQEDHLIELRTRLPLLGIEEGKRERTVEQFDEAFDLNAENAVRYCREMTAEEILDLLRMTPNYWRLDQDTLDHVATWDPVTVTISVLLLRFQKRL